MSSLKKNIITGTIWSVGGQLAYLLILLGTNIWMARILSPNEFGQIGIIMFFITIANVFTESGLGGALVRKKDALPSDYSTVFVFNLVISLLCFLLLYLSSSYIADFYNDSTLKSLLIVSGFILIINAFQIVQNAKIVSEMKFKRKSIIRLVSAILGSIVGITCAYQGLGVWSLVYMQLISAASLTLIYWITEGLFFSFLFSKKSFLELYRFGVNTTLASLLNTAFDNIYQLILGRYFSVNQVGLYYQAKKLQDVPGGIINMVSQSVIFSGLAKLQEDKESFIKAYNKITLVFLVILGFISCFIYIYSEQIILILYVNKWLGAVFYMQLLTIASFFYYQEKINRIIFKVFNKTNQILYLEFLKKGIQCLTILIGIYFLDINILIIGFIVTSIIGYYINYYYSRKILGVNNRYEIITFLKIILVSFVCIFIVYIINNQFSGVYIKLSTLPFLIILYWGGLYILKIFNFIKFMQQIKKN
ncbi:MAG: lipopolysaccharide biosynthesis protein [Bacteroidales bacterium]